MFCSGYCHGTRCALFPLNGSLPSLLEFGGTLSGTSLLITHLFRIVLIIFGAGEGGEALKHLYTAVFDQFCISVSETESKQTRS